VNKALPSRRQPFSPADLNELKSMLSQDLEGLVSWERLTVLGPGSVQDRAFSQATITGRPVADFERRMIFLPLASLYPEEDRLEVRAVAALEKVADLDQLSRQGPLLGRLARLTLEKFDLIQELHLDPMTGLWGRTKLLDELARRLKSILDRPDPVKPGLDNGRGPGRSLALVVVRLLDPDRLAERWGARFLRTVINYLAAILLEGGKSGGAARLSETVFAWLEPEAARAEALTRLRRWAAELPPLATPDHRPLKIELAGGLAAFPQDLDPGGEGSGWEAARVLARELEDLAARALVHASRLGPGSFLSLAEIRRGCGRVAEILPLDRVVIDLGRSLGLEEGMSFGVMAFPDPAGEKPEPGQEEGYKAELTVLAVGQEHSTAEIAALSDSRHPVQVGDRLRLIESEAEFRLKTGPERTMEFGGLELEVPVDQATGLPAPRAAPGIIRALTRKLTSFTLAVVRVKGLIRQRALVGQKETDSILSRVADLGREVLEPEAVIRAGVDSLVFVFAGGEGERGLALGRELTSQADAKLERSLLVGLAVHPFHDAEPVEALERAFKALDHASFPQAEPVVLFNAVSLNVSGDRHYGRGDLKAAVDEYEKALAVDPDNVNILNSLGACYGHLERLDEAARLFGRAVELAPDDFMAWYNLGQVRRRLGRPQEAVSALDRAVEIKPDDFAVLFSLGQLHLSQGRPQAAAEWFQRAAQAPRAAPVIQRWLGEAYARLDRDEEARQAFKAAVKTNPADTASLSWLGQLYLNRAGDREVALSLTRQAVDLEPESGLYRSRLGWALLKNGAPDQALAQFRAALSLEERTGPVLWGLGRALVELGRAEEARSALEEAARLEPDLKEIAAELESLEPPEGGPGRPLSRPRGEAGGGKHERS